MKTTEVLIIGAGPSGMVFSLALSKLGVRHILIEKRSEISNHPKAHEISGRTLEILKQLGINLQDLIEEASDQDTASKIVFCQNLGKEIGRIDLSEDKIQTKYKRDLSVPIPFLNISQTEVEKVLRKKILKQKTGELILDVEWKSSLEENSYVYTTIKHRKTNELSEIKSKYVIACDGAGSDIRNFLNIKMSGPTKLQDVVNVYFTNDLTKQIPSKAKLYWILEASAPGVLIAHHPEKRWVYHHAIETPFERIEDCNENFFRKKLGKATGLGDRFPFQIESINHWTMTAQVANSFSLGRFYLVGDAAHRFPPTGGLGMNSGVVDSYNLAWKIDLVLRGIADESLLRSYERERKPVIERNCEESRKNWFRMFQIPRALGISLPLATRIKRLLLAHFPFFFFNKNTKYKILSYLETLANKKLTAGLQKPYIQRRVSNAIASQIGHFDRLELDLHYKYGSSEDIWIGKRFPHFPIKKGKRTISSHDLLSPDAFHLFVWKRKSGSEIKSQHLTLNQISIEVHSVSSDPELYPKNSLPSEGFVLVRPDGHIFQWKEEVVTKESTSKFLMDCLFSLQEGKGLSSDTKAITHQTNKSTRWKPIFFAAGISLSLFLYILYRPLPHPPKPANFNLVKLSEGKFQTWRPKPKKIFGMGLVYANHIEETANHFDPNIPPPIFLKENHSLTGPESTVTIPSKKELLDRLYAFEPDLKKENIEEITSFSPLMDYEVELAFVLLEDISNEKLAKENYSPKIAFFLANDVSARSLAVFGEGRSNRAEYWGISKSFPTFLPVSNRIWIPNRYTPDLIPDVRLRSTVNGEERQNESVSNMIYTPKEMLRFIRKEYPHLTLEKDDIVITGTPGGVAMSTPRPIARILSWLSLNRITKLKLALKKDRSRFIKDGDEVDMTAEGLGDLHNKFSVGRSQ